MPDFRNLTVYWSGNIHIYSTVLQVCSAWRMSGNDCTSVVRMAGGWTLQLPSQRQE
jgi:hypothetical protein